MSLVLEDELLRYFNVPNRDYLLTHKVAKPPNKGDLYVPYIYEWKLNIRHFYEKLLHMFMPHKLKMDNQFKTYPPDTENIGYIAIPNTIQKVYGKMYNHQIMIYYIKLNLLSDNTNHDRFLEYDLFSEDYRDPDYADDCATIAFTTLNECLMWCEKFNKRHLMDALSIYYRLVSIYHNAYLGLKTER